MGNSMVVAKPAIVKAELYVRCSYVCEMHLFIVE